MLVFVEWDNPVARFLEPYLAACGRRFFGCSSDADKESFDLIVSSGSDFDGTSDSIAFK